MGKKKQFETDYQYACDHFPKLKKYFWKEEIKCWIIDGELDICDTKGQYWDTFDIRIAVPDTYPYCVPFVLEMGGKIPREDDRHISKEGICCLDIEHRLIHMSRRGVRLVDFITNKVYPYFANQIYYEAENQYSSGEYKHHFGGIKQFYEENLQIASVEEAILILNYILNAQELGRNDTCFCGENKYKKCHWETVMFLKSIGKKQLRLDLDNFQKIIS